MLSLSARRKVPPALDLAKLLKNQKSHEESSDEEQEGLGLHDSRDSGSVSVSCFCHPDKPVMNQRGERRDHPSSHDGLMNLFTCRFMIGRNFPSTLPPTVWSVPDIVLSQDITSPTDTDLHESMSLEQQQPTLSTQRLTGTPSSSSTDPQQHHNKWAAAVSGTKRVRFSEVVIIVN
jgi:hypothetical protein